MEEDLILKQPTDRRLGDNNALPPGPPGAEYDAVDFDNKNAPPKPPALEKEKSASERSSRRRSPSGSPPPRKRKSPSRGRRSPSPPVRGRGRRSPSPRRNRYRGFSPDRRPRYGGRRSPDRRRSPPRRGGGRDRYRGRGRSLSRSISRSPTPPRRGGGGGSGRWSPKKKPNSPPQQQPPNLPRQLSQPPPSSNQPPSQYSVMAPPPPQLYGEAYGPPPGYNQYGVPPPQTGFVPTNDGYVAMQTQGTGFNTAYPPPGTWGVDAYGQQQWMPPPTQMQQMPPPQQQQQQPPPLVVPSSTQQQLPPSMPPPTAPSAATLKHQNTLSNEAPGTVEPNPQHDAVAQEAENQRDELKKQRTSYLKKTTVLKKEFKMLKEQRKDLHSGGAPASPTTKGFIDENEKLQSQIQKKLSTIENVIDMLTGIIGEENLDKDDQFEDDDALKEAALSSLQKPHGNERGSSQISNTLATSHKKKIRSSSSSSDSSSGSSSSSSSDSSSSSETEQVANNNKEEEEDDSSPERLKKKVIESMKNKDKDVARSKQDLKGPNKKERFNYVFYDPEMHWCQTCNVFPKTAKDYLNHLHTKNHMDRESIETPWHTDMVTDQFPTYENAPTKRTPIRGLTFFVPATAWYCKLCNIWMGDLHCASTHLKSQLHASRYNAFLEENPHYEVNWLADRQIVLNEQKSTPLPQQITSVSTTAAERKKTKKDDEKTNKKRKKKSDKKQKKKKKKTNKKRKRDSDSSSSSSSDSSSSSECDEPKMKKIPIEIKDLDNANPAVSIRLSMRKQENIKNDEDVPPPAPQLKVKQPLPETQLPPGGKWLVVQEGLRNKDGEKPQDTDDSIIQQWNTVQPVISESEKKLLEQLKGKLKNKSKDDQQSKGPTAQKVENDKENRERERDKDRERDRGGESRSDRSDRRDKDSGNRGRDDRDRRTARRSRTRSPTRSRSRGRDYRRNVRRSQSRSRGRMSPRGWRNRNRRNDRSRSRSLRRRSRSPYDRRRRNSRSRTRSNSRGGSSRVEKPVVRQAEFRPRVPEKDKDKEKKTNESKDKKDKTKSKPSSSTATSSTTAATGKKLPFIGKMPVFKKQASGAPGEINEKRPDELQAQQAGGFMYTMDAAFNRPPAPTAAQIQMAMMEDAYGNAPPFHPDASMMVDYDDLMPDPVQFVNIMGQAPPPPPPQNEEDDKDILPPGIDEEESEEFVPKPIMERPPPGKGALPKDLEDALNIIFPGEKKPGDDSDNEDSEFGKSKAKGETQIINDESVMQPEELAKDGIHLVTFEETSQLSLDEASQMSMNEPLVFNRPPSNPTTTAIIVSTDMELEDDNSQPKIELNIEAVPPPPPPKSEEQHSPKDIKMPEETEIFLAIPPIENNEIDSLDLNNMPDIPIPLEVNSTTEMVETATQKQIEPDKNTEVMHSIMDIDLADIPQPPPSPTESEKNRRKEELEDLAMLGIDADDMAAQCM